ncbi:hypothetical protein D9619_009112 [Psilocybe cf. subviscida]|uniref:DUF7729 domain-containing protein n=1 Tax=Psilocybe cf. subviscida TaxID=2480587 RepID=A0A8H5BWP1_9AGAR|nr:hypothetical protein D9619_009112 [Psilocybe cf. subviscida]
MFKTLVFVSALASAAFAQTSSTNTTAAAAPAGNPLIPTNISSTCTAFLTSLDSNTALAGCLSAMSTATSAFAPGSSTSSSAAVTSALTNLCSTSIDSTCPESLFRTQLANFLTACTPELVSSPVQDVLRIYDVLYLMAPMKDATCAKADDDSYCVMQSVTTARDLSNEVSESDTLAVSDLLKLLYTDNAALKRRAPVSAIVPNITTFHDTNIAFLFLNPSLAVDKLCTGCARNVLQGYMNFEGNMPYAPGLSASQILDTQDALYNAITSVCPAGFLSGAVKAAGGLGTGGPFASSAAVPAVNSKYAGVLSLALGLATLAINA